MHFLKLCASVTSCINYAYALPADPRNGDDLPNGVVHFPLSRPSLSHRIGLVKRDDSVNLQIIDRVSSFTATLSIGSNNQNVDVLVDTGSSDLWVMSAQNPYCSSSSSSQTSNNLQLDTNSNSINCSSSSMFNAERSNSFSENSTSFHITYGDGSFANGSYGQDSISYGSITIKNANFAIANKTNSSTSVWGIGLSGLEATARIYDSSGNFSPTYANLPIQMKQQGFIESVAYSLWLNDVDASSGSLLFGGVDHAKYSGSLQSVPLLSTYPGAKPNQFNVKLDKITLYQGSQSADIVTCAVSALLDSGTTYMMVPGPFLEAILNSIGGVYTNEGCFAPCSLEGGLTFDFSGAQVNVSFSEILFNTGANDVCILGMLPSDGLILGDTFLRSAYVVYDLENYEVALANAKFNVSSSSVDVITSGIPSATQASGYSNSDLTNAYSTQYATFVTVGGSRVSQSSRGDITSSNNVLGSMTGFETSSANTQISGATSASASRASATVRPTESTNQRNGAVGTSGHISRAAIILSSSFLSLYGLLLLL